MKSVRYIVLLCLSVAAFGQTINLKLPSLTDRGPADMDTPSQKRTVLLMWGTVEKCYECGTRYLMNCGDGNDECNVPPKTVLHYGWFSTKRDALQFAEEEQRDIWSLFETVSVEINQTEEEIKTPQPDKTETRKHYSLLPNK